MMVSYAKIFQAMADEKRQEILSLLEDGDKCVSELVERFDLSQSAVSKHLAVLRNAGLVTGRRCGMQVVYSLNRENLKNYCQRYFARFDCCSGLFAVTEDAGSSDN